MKLLLSPGSCYTVQAVLEFVAILLFQTSKYWDYGYVCQHTQFRNDFFFRCELCMSVTHTYRRLSHKFSYVLEKHLASRLCTGKNRHEMGDTSVVAGAVPPLLIHILKLQFLALKLRLNLEKGPLKNQLS